MKKYKRIKSRPDRSGPDRLSELPDSLIFEIFWYLPMTDVVRTSVLSKRWKDLWINVPFLNFEESRKDDDCTIIIDDDDTDRVRNFVNRALALWNGYKILKSKINFQFQLNHSLVEDINVWVQRFAKNNAIEELYLHLTYLEKEVYTVSPCLYSCSSLKVLVLNGCHLQINRNVEWKQLKSLTIDGYCIEEEAIKKVLCGSPNLEVFLLRLLDSNENLCVKSSSLKKLSIKKYKYCSEEYPSMETKLKIWAPNLETLEIFGVPYRTCLLKNVASLKEATLRFSGLIDHCWNDFLEDTLRQILPSIQHVENVTLSDWCIKVLWTMKKKSLLSPFYNVEFLKLNSSFKKHEQIAGLLEIFPLLKRLVLEDLNHNQNISGKSFEFEPQPNLFLQQLRIVEVTWDGGNNSMLPLIQILLKYASNLEKMIFRVNGINPKDEDMVLILKKLMRMPRSSPTAELIWPFIDELKI